MVKRSLNTALVSSSRNKGRSGIKSRRKARKNQTPKTRSRGGKSSMDDNKSGRRSKSKNVTLKKRRRQAGGGSSQQAKNLATLNAITWDVLQLPERAIWKGKTAAENRNILERILHKGSIRLLLPVVRNSTEEHGGQMVAYAVIVKGRDALDKEIRFGDILHKIHGFYMGTKVASDDIAYASMGDASVPAGRKPGQIRFGNFIEGQTRFNGLTDQGNGTYVLALK